MTEYLLGQQWFECFYPKVQEALHYSRRDDELSRDILSNLLSYKRLREPRSLSAILNRTLVVMVGAGPSLDSDLNGLEHYLHRNGPPIVAADGAADALYERNLSPSIIVSDLDSCSTQNLVRNSKDGYVFVHAHGDNLNLVKRILPELGGCLYGTTQVSSAPRVENFGGLTDGDRACYIISSYDPRAILIAGMDFGTKEGRYSRNKHDGGATPKRNLKLVWGKRSLEFLIKTRLDIQFFNVTKHGEEIVGTTRLDYSDITSTT